MAKAKDSGSSKDALEMKKIMDKLFKVVQTSESSSKEQVRINRELLKVMSLIESGFVANARDAKELISKVESEGYAITDEFITKWAKERKISKDDLTEITKKFREIEKINSDIIDDSKNYNALKKATNQLLDGEIDLTKNLLGNYEDILKSVQASKKQIGQFGVGLDKVYENLKASGSEINLDSMFDDSKSSIEGVQTLISNMKSDLKSLVSSASGELFNVDLNFNPLTDQLDTEIAKTIDNVKIEKNLRIDALRSSFKENEKLQTNMLRQMAGQKIGIEVDVDTGQIKTLTGILEPGTKEFEKMAKELDKTAKNKGFKEILIPSFEELVDLISLGNNLTEEQKKRYSELIKPIGAAGQILAENNLAHQVNLQLQEKEIAKQYALVKGLSEFSDKLKTAESIVLKVGSGFEYINELLPAGISEFIGLSKVSGALMDSHKKGVEDFAAELQKSSDYSKSMASYMKAFKPALSLALNPMLLIVTSAVLLFKFVSSITDKYKEMASEMKISLGQAKELHQVQLDTLTSQKNQFATMKDIQDVQTSMIGTSGKMFDLNNKGAKELSINLIEVGKYFGYGNEQAVELHKTFERLGADDKMSLNLQKNLGMMSEMAGLSPQIVAQDLIDSAAEVATYFGGMPELAAKTAINVRRMGLSLKQAGGIAQDMIADMEGFMTDMYELQAMSAGGIDFSGAFEKGLMGDIEGMTRDIVKEMGTIEDFNRMDPTLRMKTAKTLGMSVDELAKSVMLQSKMAGLGDDQQKYLQANLDRMGDISSLSQDDIKNKLQSLQSTDRLGVAWDKIKGVLVNSLLPLVESLATGIDAISPILDILIMGLKGIGSIIKMIGPLIQVILRPLTWGTDLLKSMTGEMDEFGDSVSGTGKYLGEVVKILIGIGEIIGGIFIAKRFGLLNNGIGEFASKIPIIGKLFGSADKSAKDTAASSAASVREMASSVQSSMSSMVDSIGSTMTGIADSIKETFNSITSGAQNVSAEASKVSANVAESLQKDTSIVSSAATKMNSEVAASVSKTTSSVTASTAKMAKDAQIAVTRTQAVAAKGGKMSFINPDTARKGFGTIGEIASKTFAIMAMRSATSFFTMKKDGEEATSSMTDNMGGMFDMAFMGAGSLLTGYLSEGIEKVFSKKIEKGIEGKLEKPIKKLSKAFGSVENSGTKAFDGIETKGKGVFGRIADFAKKILPGSTTSMLGTFDNLADQGKQVLAPIEQVQDVISKTKSISEKTVQSTTRSRKINIPSPQEPIQDVAKKTGSGFSSFTNILKTVWDGIKTVLTDIVKFVSTSMKELSSGIGEAIKNVLKGIGDGLSSFKGSALKGAATLVILSGALWIASKAIQNFTSVKWEDLAKAGVALGGLAIVALSLGSASVQMLIGAVAIAALGAALIPAAYALDMFAKIEWSSLAKAGVALIGLGVAGGIIGSFLPLMLLGAIGIAALGASLLPLSAALLIATPGLEAFGNVIQKAFNGIATVITATASGISQVFETLGNIDVMKLLTIGPALASIGLGLAAMSAGAVSSSISKLFGGDVVKDLEKLGNLAEPLYIVQKVLTGLNDALFVLAETLANLDLSGLDKLAEIPKIGIDSVAKEKIKPIVQNYEGVQQDSTQVKISPVQSQVPKVQTPRKEAMAQDKLLNTKGSNGEESGMTLERTASTQFAASSPYQVNQRQTDTYQEDTIPDNQETNMLLKQMVALMQILVKKDPTLVLDGQKISAITKKFNNN